MVTKSVIIGRTLAVLGIVLFIAGAVFCIVVSFGSFRTLAYAGVGAMIIGNTIGWFGKSLAAGTLKQEIKETIKYEASETLRLQTRLRPMTAVLVVIGFIMAAAAGVFLSWVLSQNA